MALEEVERSNNGTDRDRASPRWLLRRSYLLGILRFPYCIYPYSLSWTPSTSFITCPVIAHGFIANHAIARGIYEAWQPAE